MTLTGLHLLLSYACTSECDHCFVWSGPDRPGVFTPRGLEEVLEQAQDAGVEWIYFEGGEPFLHYPVLRWGVHRASDMGFRVGVVTNAYWAEDPSSARECLMDLVGRVDDLTISCDLYHGGDEQKRRMRNARAAAAQLGMPCAVTAIAQPGASGVAPLGQLPAGESVLMYRGRAAERLAPQAPAVPPDGLTSCPYEDLRDPGRVHVDPFGYVHVCQGIAIGNLFRTPLQEICANYDPDAHPVVAPLLHGGPRELARRYEVPLAPGYADACHLCDWTRHRLRARFPEVLAPDAMYGVTQAG